MYRNLLLFTPRYRQYISSKIGQLSNRIAHYQSALSLVHSNYHHGVQLSAPLTFSKHLFKRTAISDYRCLSFIFPIVFLSPELIPLLVCKFPRIIPTTFWTEEERKQNSHALKRIRQDALIGWNGWRQEMDWKHLRIVCRVLNVNSFGFSWMLRKRVEREIDWLEQNDSLLDKEIEEIEEEEVRKALELRGISVESGDRERKNLLKTWLQRKTWEGKVELWKHNY